MICTQVKNYVILISQLTFSRLATTNSSVLCFIGSNNGGIYIFVFICTMKYLNFKLRQENTFILSEKMCVVIVQDSKNFITHHSFSFSCQAVRLLLILLIAFFFSFGCVEMIKIDFNKTFLSPILDEEREYLFQSGPVTRVKSVIVC